MQPVGRETTRPAEQLTISWLQSGFLERKEAASCSDDSNGD